METTPGYSNTGTLIRGICYKVLEGPEEQREDSAHGRRAGDWKGVGGEGMSPPAFARDVGGGSSWVDSSPEFLLRHHSSRQQQRTLTLASPSNG